MTPEQREKMATDWMNHQIQQCSAMFGVRFIIPDPITNLPNGGFAYTPPTLKAQAIEGWQPPAPPEEGKPE